MNNQRITSLIERLATKMTGQAPVWTFEYGGRQFFVMTDETHDRMRAMTPIVSQDVLTEDDLETVLEANFDRALDARFALYKDTLWSLFLHPLRNLSDQQFEDCLRQVSQLADNYGTSYSSSDLTFGGGGGGGGNGGGN